MKRFALVVLVGLIGSSFCGCGETKTAAPVAEQDALKKYAAENPHDESLDTGVDSGEGT